LVAAASTRKVRLANVPETEVVGATVVELVVEWTRVLDGSKVDARQRCLVVLLSCYWLGVFSVLTEVQVWIGDNVGHSLSVTFYGVSVAEHLVLSQRLCGPISIT
jgi:hypothetical protein